MTTSEIAYYHEKLVHLFQHLETGCRHLKKEALRATGGEASGGLSNAPMHMGDLGSDLAEEELDLQLVENQELMMRDVNDALERIQNNTFGMCEECNKPISKARLTAIPYTRYCIHCAETLESPR